MPVLTIAGISKSFGGVAALSRCSIDVAPGAVTGIIGPNGAGKSTLLNVVSGLLSPDEGTIQFQGRDITGLPAFRRARLGIVRTFQISRELGSLTVLENLLLARPNQTGENLWAALTLRRRMRREEDDAIAEARALLERVGLWNLADQPASALSGGQKKLLELARALMLRPKLILLDEPAAGVSPPLVRELCRIIDGLRREGLTFVVVEHDMDMVASLCDRVYVLAVGTNLAEGTYSSVTADRRVIDAYLGAVA